MRNILISLGITTLSSVVASATTVLVDFGLSSTTTTGIEEVWNNVTSTSVGVKISNLSDTGGASTNYGLSISVSGFSGGTDIGQSSSTLTPTNAYRDGFYGAYAGSGLGSSTLLLTGLNPSLTYTFSFFGSVNRGETRMSRYSIGSESVELEAQNNSTNWSAPISATPDASGNLEIVISQGTGNNAYSYMLNAMQIDYIPEPSTAMLSTFALIPMLRRRRTF